MRRLVSALAIVMLLLACKTVTSGVVISKQYEPAYDYMTMQCAGYDSKMNCIAYMPILNHVPDSWALELRDDSEDKPTKDQDTGWVEVDSNTFGQYKLGDHYP